MNEQILTSLSYGLYALGVRGEHYPSACIVNTVFQVTASPPIIAVSINHNNYSHECILKEKKFCISVLSEETPSNVIGTLNIVCLHLVFQLLKKTFAVGLNVMLLIV